MIICLLGRQPELGFEELSCLYGTSTVNYFGSDSALVETDGFDVQAVGGTQKAGRIITRLSHTDWSSISRFIVDHYSRQLKTSQQKVTLGISVHGTPRITPKIITQTALHIKKSLKISGVSCRLVPNKAPALNTAVSHHNKLGLSPHKIEIIVVTHGSKTVIAESIGAQNITALARRDQERPARDAFVGMLPPKLALMMVNMATGLHSTQHNPLTILDPFCGTGVVLQEAWLRGYSVYGSDLSDKMVEYTTRNLKWLQETHRNVGGDIQAIRQGDATTFKWQEAPRLSAVVCESYLGQPFSATPSAAKLREVRGNCNHIISQFLTNIHHQLEPGTSLCVAVPAWRDLKTSRLTRLPLTSEAELQAFGYEVKSSSPLLYYREDQVVARDILLLARR